MKKLVLCVDRDDDVGRKGRVNTPLIGRDAVMDGLLALGLSDPEDSDTNTILSSLKLYDELVEGGGDAEVAVICGDVKLGLRADETLATQLETVLRATQANGVILVSDGAEDESFYPVISSRVKVLSLNRVFVKQAPNIERTIHIALNTMREEKIQRKVYVPLALALMVYGICLISGYAGLGLGAIAITLGAYFFVKAYNLEENVLSFYGDIQTGMVTGRISLPFTVVAAVLAVGGGVFGWSTWQSSNPETLLDAMVIFVQGAIWWFVVAAFVYGMGRVLDAYIKDRVFNWMIFSYTFSLVAMGMIISGAMYLIRLFIPYNLGNLDVELLKLAFTNIVFGITIAIIGGYVHHYVREHTEQGTKVEEEKPAPEAQK